MPVREPGSARPPTETRELGLRVRRWPQREHPGVAERFSQATTDRGEEWT